MVLKYFLDFVGSVANNRWSSVVFVELSFLYSFRPRYSYMPVEPEHLNLLLLSHYYVLFTRLFFLGLRFIYWGFICSLVVCSVSTSKKFEFIPSQSKPLQVSYPSPGERRTVWRSTVKVLFPPQHQWGLFFLRIRQNGPMDDQGPSMQTHLRESTFERWNL